MDRLKFTIEGQQIPFQPRFDKGKGFEMIDLNGQGIVVDISSPLGVPEIDFDLYSSIALQKRNVKESQICEFACKKNGATLGWLIPITALNSVDHDYNNNRFFIKAAYAALHAALDSNLQGCSKEIHLDNTESLSVCDIYEDSICFLVLNKFQISDKTSLDPDCLATNLVARLYSYGYRYAEATILPSNFTAKEAPIGKVRVDTKSGMFNDQFIRSLFYEILPRVDNPIAEFLYLYQVIEVFIDKIFESEFKVIVADLKSKQVDSFEAKKSLSRLMEEMTRFTKLLNRYTKFEHSKHSEVLTSGKSLLPDSNNEQNNLVKIVYSIRSKLVHETRIFHNSSRHSELSRFNFEFSSLLYDIILNFNLDEPETR